MFWLGLYWQQLDAFRASAITPCLRWIWWSRTIVRHWSHSLLKKMYFEQRKVTTSKTKHTMTNFAQLRRLSLRCGSNCCYGEDSSRTHSQLESDRNQSCPMLILDNEEMTEKGGGKGWCWWRMPNHCQILQNNGWKSYLCSWCTREWHPAAILVFLSHQAGTLLSRPLIN